MRIAMVGTGYVGLVSGACFSEFGVDVVCVDKVQSKIDKLKALKIKKRWKKLRVMTKFFLKKQQVKKCVASLIMKNFVKQELYLTGII